MKDNGTVPWITHPWVAKGQNTVRFGVGLLDPGTDWSVYHDSIQMAEELGFDSYWTWDHPLYFAECWATLATLAVTSKTIRLGSLVSCIFYRSPALLARMAADVDRWSHGRLILGIGIGDDQGEFAALGLPFPSVRERQQALDEAIQVVLGLWGETPFTFRGHHFQMQEANVWPPVQQPHVPILIAGGGERVTLRQVAQYADISSFMAHAWTGSAFGLDNVRRKFEVLRSHCEAIGRPYESVLRSYSSMPVVLAQTHHALRAKLDAIPEHERAFWQSSLIASVAPSEVVAHYQSLIDAGVQYFMLGLSGQDLETLQLLAQEVVPALTQAKKVSEA